MLEQRGKVTDAVEARVISLLQRDLQQTVGVGHEFLVDEPAARIRLFSDEPADFEQRVVDDVQQCLHDTFVDTTWPACPEHLNHPLWYSDGWWRCNKSGKSVAPLGGLGDMRADQTQGGGD